VARLAIGHLPGGRLASIAAAHDGAPGRNGGSRSAKPRAIGCRLSYRRETLEEQMECLSLLLAGALATGHTLVQALESCANEITGYPLGPEIRRVVDGYRVGTPILTGLISMADRLRHPDADYLVRVIEIHLMSGGDLRNALGSVGDTIRERRSLRWEVRAGCADARLSAGIMAACPPVLIIFTAAARPEMLQALVGTSLGRICLMYGLLSWLMGLYLSNRVTKVDDG